MIDYLARSGPQPYRRSSDMWSSKGEEGGFLHTIRSRLGVLRELVMVRRPRRSGVHPIGAEEPATLDRTCGIPQSWSIILHDELSVDRSAWAD